MGQPQWHVWGHYLSLFAAFALLDGSIIGFFNAYPSHPVLSMPGPVVLFTPVPVAFIATTAASLFMFAAEQFGVHVILKLILTLVAQLTGYLGFSTIPGASFATCAFLVYAMAFVKGQVYEEEPKPRKAATGGKKV